MSQGLMASAADAELLVRYANLRRPEDFAEIVARHGPMVLRACQRLTGSAADAEDAAQAAFLALSRKPLAAQGNLAGWLHKAARDCALQIVRSGARRARREEVHARMRTLAQPRNGELREELDAALIQLPADLREAVVLRYLEGRDGHEAARLAGCNDNTFRWRAMKGLERLRLLLSRRGAVCTTSVLAAFLASEAAVQASTATLASLTAVATVGAASAPVAAAATQVLNGFFWAKAKLYMVATAAAMTVAGAASAPFLMSQPGPVPAQTVSNPVQLGMNGSLGGRRPFPDDNPWNQDIRNRPVDPNSDQLIAAIGRDQPLYANFSRSAGIPYMVVSGEQPGQPIRFGEFAKESDPGPYPLPDDAPIEADARYPRMVVLERDAWKLYELTNASRDKAGNWSAAGGFIFDLGSNRQRPAGWTSADGAGLPIFPGLVRHDEVAEMQAIRHALRFSAPRIRQAYVAPARHAGGRSKDASLPPFGMRVRLKADIDITSFPPQAQVILRALQTHGMFLAEGGSPWYLQGTADSRWDEKDLRSLGRVKGKDFEVIELGAIQTK